MAVDTRTQAVIGHRVAKGLRHDARTPVPLIDTEGLPCSHAGVYRIGKAYDDEKIHKTVREEAHAECMIPLRKKARKGRCRLSMQNRIRRRQIPPKKPG